MRSGMQAICDLIICTVAISVMEVALSPWCSYLIRGRAAARNSTTRSGSQGTLDVAFKMKTVETGGTEQ